MSRILFFGDLHLADKAPSGRVDDYRQTILNKLAAIGQLCQQYDVDLAVQDGDWFHVKVPNRVSHRLVQDTIRVASAFPCPIWTIKGNHDIAADGGIEQQPLGVLHEAEAVVVLEEIVRTEDFWLVPRHYSTGAEGFSTGEVDPSYYSLTEDEQNRIAEDPAFVIGVAHGSLLAPGDSRPYPFVTVDQIPNLQAYDLLVSGHIHEALGIVEIGKTVFVNMGSIGRTKRDLASYSRTIEVLIVEVDDRGLTITEVPLPGVRPALEVFGRRTPDEAPDMNSDDISNFVEMLSQGIRADQLSIPELLSELSKTENIEPAVKAEVQRLLEEAEV